MVQRFTGSADSVPAVPVPVLDVCGGLLELFGGVPGRVPDGRSGQGRDHPTAVVLALAAAAVVAGMKGYTAITGWVADVSAAVLADLYLRAGAIAPGPPSKTTIWRVPTHADPEVFDAAVGTWLVNVAGFAAPAAGGVDDGAPGCGALMQVRLDGKAIRGAKDVLPGRTADVVEEWLRDHPGVQVVCRDGSGAYGEAVRRASGHRTGQRPLAPVARPGRGRPAGSRRALRLLGRRGPPQAGKRAGTTLQRWQQVHDLIGKGAGLLECVRRLDLSLNTVKCYARRQARAAAARPAGPAHARRPLPRAPPQVPGRGPRGAGPERSVTIENATEPLKLQSRPSPPDNPNGAVAKSRRQRAVPLDFVTVQAFDAYEFERMRVPAAASNDFVLVNLFRPLVGAPMRLNAVNDLVAATVRRAG